MTINFNTGLPDDPVKPERHEIAWTDKDGVHHSMGIEGARALLEKFWDEWPGGWAEVEAEKQARALAAPTAPAPTEPVAWFDPTETGGFGNPLVWNEREMERQGKALPEFQRTFYTGRYPVPNSWVPFYATPPSAAQPEAVPVDDGYPFYELRFIMRVLGHEGGAPKADWQTAYGMAKAIFMRWHSDKLAAAPTTEPRRAPTAEPVAWEYGEDLFWHTSPELNDHIRQNGRALVYATPPGAATEPSDAERQARRPLAKINRYCSAGMCVDTDAQHEDYCARATKGGKP